MRLLPRTNVVYVCLACGRDNVITAEQVRPDAEWKYICVQCDFCKKANNMGREYVARLPATRMRLARAVVALTAASHELHKHDWGPRITESARPAVDLVLDELRDALGMSPNELAPATCAVCDAVLAGPPDWGYWRCNACAEKAS